VNLKKNAISTCSSI